MILALVMALALVACGNKNTDDGNKDTPDDNKTPTVITNPDEVQDEMTSSDGKYEVAFVTDVGQLKDKSFNQGTYDGVKLYAANNNLSYKYYQPANGSEATDDDRFAAMKAAVDNGAKVVVCAGYLQEAALRTAAKQFTDVSFVFIDGYPVGEEANVKDSPLTRRTLPALPLRKSSAAIWPVTLLSRKATPSWASPVAAAATTPPAAVTAMASCRALTPLPRS